MSHTKAEASRKRRVLSEEFKQDAVRLVVSEKCSFAAAAKAVGVGEQSLRMWQCSPSPETRAVRRYASLDDRRLRDRPQAGGNPLADAADPTS